MLSVEPAIAHYWETAVVGCLPDVSDGCWALGKGLFVHQFDYFVECECGCL
jgi:hypothetical protein